MNAWAEKVFFLSEYVSEKMSEHNRFPTELTPQEIEKRGLQRQCNSGETASRVQASPASVLVHHKKLTVSNVTLGHQGSRIPPQLKFYNCTNIQVYRECWKSCVISITMFFSLSEDVIVCSQSYRYHYIFGAEVDSSSSTVYLNRIKSPWRVIL